MTAATNELSGPSLPPIDHPLPGDFSGAALAANPETFTMELDSPARRALAVQLDAIERGGVEAAIEADVHAILRSATARVQTELTSGVGLLLLRGVPVEGRSRDALGALFGMMGRALGRLEPQTLDGEMLTDVRDTGDDPSNPDVRRYRTRAEQDFHTDGADVIGLLCLHGAKQGGASRIVSSIRVQQVVRERRPDLWPLLFEPWFFRIPGALARGLPGAFPRPIATFDGKKLETFYIGWYIRDAEGIPGVPALTAERRELLALYEATANDPSLYVDMEFRPGDVQWLRNAFVLHKRTAYEDHPEEHRKRHLLRLWVSAPGIDDSMPRFDPGGGVPK